MQRLEQPFRLYTDPTGKPLDAGYVYFGVAGQSPDVSPVTVYWDEAGTTPAAQPLRTAAGYIVRNGSPANVYYSGTYSELVKDKNGVQLFVELTRNTNPDGYLKTLNAGQVTSALGYSPVNGTFNSAVMSGRAIVNAADNTDFTGFGSESLIVKSATSPLIQFERPDAYILKAGLNGLNNYCVGGGSQGAYVYRLTSDPSGNLVALGNVTAYSDLRRKTNIEPLAQPTERLLQMRGFTYLDTITGQRKIGVGAQEVQRAGFPEAVVADDDGALSVAYGQLALPLLIEVVRELDKRLKVLESENTQLKGNA